MPSEVLAVALMVGITVGVFAVMVYEVLSWCWGDCATHADMPHQPHDSASYCEAAPGRCGWGSASHDPPATCRGPAVLDVRLSVCPKVAVNAGAKP